MCEILRRRIDKGFPPCLRDPHQMKAAILMACLLLILYVAGGFPHSDWIGIVGAVGIYFEIFVLCMMSGHHIAPLNERNLGTVCSSSLKMFIFSLKKKYFFGDSGIRAST